MAQRHQIRCINKADRYDAHERIINIGGLNGTTERWKISVAEAIKGIERGDWQFYVMVNGSSADVIIAVSRYGHKYLKTIADGEQPNNLLSLPECP